MFKTLEKLKVDSLAHILRISEDKLFYLAKTAPRLYREKQIAKNGKTRTIEIPSIALKKKQKLLSEKILYYLPVHPRLYGCPGTSIKDAVRDHVGKPIVITMDIKNFFPNVKKYQIKKMLRRRKAREDVAEILARLITCKNHLPHGSPSSPCIARLVLNPFAMNLEKLLMSIHSNAVFSIYVDDIILSGPDGIRRAIPTICQLINRQGFDVNPEKTEVMKQDSEQVSLNIRLNKRIEPTTAYLNKLGVIKDQHSSLHPTVKGMQAFADFLFKGEG